jgi:hypothetical protein
VWCTIVGTEKLARASLPCKSKMRTTTRPKIDARLMCVVYTQNLWLLSSSREQWPFLHFCCPILSSAAAASPLIGKRALCLSVVVLSVVHISHLPLFSLAVVLVHDLQFFSATCFDLFSYRRPTDRQKINYCTAAKGKHLEIQQERGVFSGCAFPLLGLLIW